MATDLEKLVVQLSADVKGYERAMQRAVGVTNKQASAIEGRYRRMNRSLDSIGRNAARSLITPFIGLGAALSVREITGYADAWTSAGNKIAAAGQAAGVQTRSLSELRKGADDARVSLEAYTELYARLIRSASGVAKSEEEVALATNLVSKAMKAGGASTQEQQASLVQLGQALGSGVLQGDELRSLRENAPIVAQAIANEFETTIAGLKKLGSEGELISARVFKAIIAAGPEIEAQFAKTNQTIADGFTKLKNALKEYVGTAAQASGITATVNGILGALAGNIESVAAAAAAAAAVLVGRYVPALVRAAGAQALILATNPFLALTAGISAAAFALAKFGDEIKPIEGELANLQDYSGAVWDRMKDGAATAGSDIADSFLGIINTISDAIGGIEVSWTDVLEFTREAANGMVGALVAAYEVIKITFTQLPQAVADGVITTINAMVKSVQDGINKIVDGINTLRDAARNSLPAALAAQVEPNLDPVDLKGIENQFAGAGEVAGDAYKKAIEEALSGDYLGEAFAGLREDANLKGFVRTIDQTLDKLEAGGGGTEGFGSAAGATVPSVGGGRGGGGRGRKQSAARQNELERETEQILERTAALRAETAAQATINPLIDDYGYTMAKAKAQQDLLTAAEKAGISLTPALRDKIAALAEAYAQAEVASGKLAESQDEIVRRAEEMAALREDVMGGFIKDLAHGTSAAGAFSAALGKIGDRLIDIGVNSLFSTGNSGGFLSRLLGGFGGGRPSSGTNLLAGVYHQGGVVGSGGTKRAVSPALFAGAPRYHAGGIAGLKPGEVPSILQKGEVVLPKMPSTALAQQPSVSISVNVSGARGNAEISEMVQMGVGRGLREYDSQMPSRVRQISDDPRRMGR